MSFAGRAKSALDVTSTIVLTVAAGALAWNLLKSPDATQASSAPRPQVESVSGLRIETAQATNRMGQSPVAIVEFSDYECPFCAQHTRETYPSIQRGLIEPGLVTYVSLAFPLERIHRNARKAAEAAECAARQGRFWEMHGRLFTSPSALVAQALSDSAQVLGLDVDRFQECLHGAASVKVAGDMAEGRRLGVNSTPTFFVGLIQPDGSIDLMKRLNGVVTFDDFRNSVAEVSKSSSKVSGASGTS